MNQTNNIAASERLDHAIMYLVDLLRAYGKRAIIVNINQQGEEVNIVAKDFVKRQLATAGIKFWQQQVSSFHIERQISQTSVSSINISMLTCLASCSMKLCLNWKMLM